MENDFSNFLAQGNILTLGDLNARTGNLKDYLMYSTGDQIVGLDFSDDINLSHRFNPDTVINGYGRKRIDLCKNNNMQILNGRSQGDTPG